MNRISITFNFYFIKNTLTTTIIMIIFTFFNTELPVSIPCKQSSFVIDENSEDKDMPQTAIGQGKTMITPIHNAMIIASIAK